MIRGRGPIRRLGGWACLLLLLANATDARALSFDTRMLSPEEAAASQRLLMQARAQLPPSLLDALDARTVVQWRDLPQQVHGRSRGHHVGLQRSLLPAWIARSNAAHDTQTDSPALRALIHELAHQYDRGAQGRTSRDPRLLDLAGWPRRAWGGRSTRNGFIDRMPDAYERESPREFVAVNLEYFVLDPEYACRRPALFRYFADHLRWTPPTSERCAAALPFVEPDEHASATLAALDPQRIYAVDYLLAEANAAPMSRWGHAMLRLVICAPERVPGPDCRLDLAYHRVLSFRAFVGDVQISSWRGLTGSYPSRLFLLPLDQVIDEYTRTELRGLQSIPLRLGHEEILAIAGRAAQTHWGYDGRYYFLGNNCAVETWRLLQDAVPRLGDARLRSITPTGLLSKLERAGIADVSVLTDRDEARRLGFYFEPMSARLSMMFAVARESLALPQKTAEEWLALPPERRRAWLQRGDIRVTAALLVLEEAARRRQDLRARDMLKRRLLSGGNHADVARSQVRDWLMQGEFFSRPAMLAKAGYGIPVFEERDRVAVEIQHRAGALREQNQALEDQARLWLPEDQRRRLDGIRLNLDLLGERLRATQ